MTIPQRPADDELMRRIKALEQQVYALQRGNPNGRQSLGIDALRPGRKAGVPSDADYTTANMPPIGTHVLNTSTGDVYWRVAVGSWKKLTPA
jgi:hypothetical protein